MVEWAKAPSLDRGVVSGRRARQLWLQPARWLGCPCVLASSRQAFENAGLGLLWGWAKPGCVAVVGVAMARVNVGSAASHRRIPLQMYGLSCGMLPATTHPSHTPLSLALFVSSGRSLETRAHPLFGR